MCLVEMNWQTDLNMLNKWEARFVSIQSLWCVRCSCKYLDYARLNNTFAKGSVSICFRPHSISWRTMTQHASLWTWTHFSEQQFPPGLFFYTNNRYWYLKVWINKDQTPAEPKDTTDKPTSPQLCTSTIIPPPPYVPFPMVSSNAVTPVDVNYGQSGVYVKSELTELHTVSEPSLVSAGLSPQHGNLVFLNFLFTNLFSPQHYWYLLWWRWGPPKRFIVLHMRLAHSLSLSLR